ncbi:MAG: TIR domain-containing protein [Pseudomonadota bacterium]|nr:TIR domain-containing protein [Pseudomonadota bacterium]
MTTSPAEIFLSYKAEDRSRLKPLVAALQAEGFGVWWDAQIGSGSHWRADIQEHLDAAKCVIVAWSKRSVGPDGDFVRDEASRARRNGSYLPILLDPVEPPLGFGEVQALSLGRWKGNRTDPRYIALIAAVRSRIAGEEIGPVPAHLGRPPVSRRAVIAGGVGAAAVAATGGWLLLKPDAANARRIAVLPFANMSSDREQAYFSEGVAEELRAALSRIGLEVIGRASSDAVKDLDTKSAAEKLGVAHILSGSVRRSPQTIRIDAQLVSGSDGVERWRQSYDRAPGDAIRIQTDIATSVAQALSVALGQGGRAAIRLGGTADSMAQDLYLKASEVRRKADSEGAVREALTLLNAAIDRDPNYADAYVLRASAYASLGSNFPKSAEDIANNLALAEAAARQAMSIAPQLGSAHAGLADIALSRLHFASSLDHMRQALALSPYEARVVRGAATIIPYLGDGQEALQLADRLLALDPLEARTFAARSLILQLLRDHVPSIEAGRRALVLAPQSLAARGFIADSLTLLDRSAEARAEYSQLPPGDLFRMTGEARIAARAGDKAAAERTIAQLREEFGAAASYQYAQIHAQARDADRAFAELEIAVQAKDPGLLSLKVDPFLDPIRSDGRYAALIKRMRFP